MEIRILLVMIDGFVKSPHAALCCILRHCSVQQKYAAFLRICTPWLRTFYKAVRKSTFFEGIMIDDMEKNALEKSHSSSMNMEPRCV
jgi:hypothetical protein